VNSYYSTLKFLRFKDQLDALAEGRVVAPVYIRLKLTNHCNHDCWYCAYHKNNMTLGEEMRERDSIPPERMLALAHELVDVGVKAVAFSGGGEPLLYKQLPEVIDILATGGIRVAALTNGANLKGRVADSFAQHGTWVRISIDAWDDASYVKSRGAKPDEFSRLIDNIRAFTARDTPCVLGVSFIVDQNNYQHITEACAMLKDCGVNHVKLSAVVISNDVAGNNDYHRSIKDEVARQISLAQPLVDATFAIINHYHDLEDRFEKNYHTCPFLQFNPVIGADQNVYTCHDKAYTQSGRMGSIADMTFKDFWFSEENQSFMRNFDPSDQCRHHCLAHSKNLAIHEYLSLDQEHSYFV